MTDKKAYELFAAMKAQFYAPEQSSDSSVTNLAADEELRVILQHLGKRAEKSATTRARALHQLAALIANRPPEFCQGFFPLFAITLERLALGETDSFVVMAALACLQALKTRDERCIKKNFRHIFPIIYLLQFDTNNEVASQAYDQIASLLPEVNKKILAVYKTWPDVSALLSPLLIGGKDAIKLIDVYDDEAIKTQLAKKLQALAAFGISWAFDFHEKLPEAPRKEMLQRLCALVLGEGPEPFVLTLFKENKEDALIQSTAVLLCNNLYTYNRQGLTEKQWALIARELLLPAFQNYSSLLNRPFWQDYFLVKIVQDPAMRFPTKPLKKAVLSFLEQTHVNRHIEDDAKPMLIIKLLQLEPANALTFLDETLSALCRPLKSGNPFVDNNFSVIYELPFQIESCEALALPVDKVSAIFSNFLISLLKNVQAKSDKRSEFATSQIQHFICKFSRASSSTLYKRIYEDYSGKLLELLAQSIKDEHSFPYILTILKAIDLSSERSYSALMKKCLKIFTEVVAQDTLSDQEIVALLSNLNFLCQTKAIFRWLDELSLDSKKAFQQALQSFMAQAFCSLSPRREDGELLAALIIKKLFLTFDLPVFLATCAAREALSFRHAALLASDLLSPETLRKYLALKDLNEAKAGLKRQVKAQDYLSSLTSATYFSQIFDLLLTGLLSDEFAAASVFIGNVIAVDEVSAKTLLTRIKDICLQGKGNDKLPILMAELWHHSLRSHPAMMEVGVEALTATQKQSAGLIPPFEEGFAGQSAQICLAFIEKTVEYILLNNDLAPASCLQTASARMSKTDVEVNSPQLIQIVKKLLSFWLQDAELCATIFKALCDGWQGKLKFDASLVEEIMRGEQLPLGCLFAPIEDIRKLQDSDHLRFWRRIKAEVLAACIQLVLGKKDAFGLVLTKFHRPSKGHASVLFFSDFVQQLWTTKELERGDRKMFAQMIFDDLDKGTEEDRLWRLWAWKYNAQRLPLDLLSVEDLITTKNENLSEGCIAAVRITAIASSIPGKTEEEQVEHIEAILQALGEKEDNLSLTLWLEVMSRGLALGLERLLAERVCETQKKLELALRDNIDSKEVCVPLFIAGLDLLTHLASALDLFTTDFICWIREELLHKITSILISLRFGYDSLSFISSLPLQSTQKNALVSAHHCTNSCDLFVSSDNFVQKVATAIQLFGSKGAKLCAADTMALIATGDATLQRAAARCISEQSLILGAWIPHPSDSSALSAFEANQKGRPQFNLWLWWGFVWDACAASRPHSAENLRLLELYIASGTAVYPLRVAIEHFRGRLAEPDTRAFLEEFEPDVLTGYWPNDAPSEDYAALSLVFRAAATAPALFAAAISPSEGEESASSIASQCRALLRSRLGILLFERQAATARVVERNIRVCARTRTIETTIDSSEIAHRVTLRFPPTFPLEPFTLEVTHEDEAPGRARRPKHNCCRGPAGAGEARSAVTRDAAAALRAARSTLDHAHAQLTDCYICYSTFHAKSRQPAEMPCKVCRKKFHSECIKEWFETSGKSECPLCKSLFF